MTSTIKITQSQVEPNTKNIWLHNGVLKRFNGNEWILMTNHIYNILTSILTNNNGSIKEGYDILNKINEEGGSGQVYTTLTPEEETRSMSSSVFNINVIKVEAGSYVRLIGFSSSTLDRGNPSNYGIYIITAEKIKEDNGDFRYTCNCEFANTQTSEVLPATDTRIGGVRVMDGSGLLISDEGNLYVHMTDDPSEDSSDDIVPTVIALREVQAQIPNKVNSIPVVLPTATLEELIESHNNLIAELKISGVMKNQ